MGFALVIFVLYIALIKLRRENVVYKWFTVHLFIVHFVLTSMTVVTFIVDFFFDRIIRIGYSFTVAIEP